MGPVGCDDATTPPIRLSSECPACPGRLPNHTAVCILALQTEDYTRHVNKIQAALPTICRFSPIQDAHPFCLGASSLGGTAWDGPSSKFWCYCIGPPNFWCPFKHLLEWSWATSTLDPSCRAPFTGSLGHQKKDTYTWEIHGNPFKGIDHMKQTVSWEKIQSHHT